MRYLDVDEEGREIAQRDRLGRQAKQMEPRYLEPHQQDPIERQGSYSLAWDLDLWRATRDCSFEIHVDGPRPVGHRGLATIYGPPTKRKYTLKANEEFRVPRMYRDAMQRIENGIIQ